MPGETRTTRILLRRLEGAGSPYTQIDFEIERGLDKDEIHQRVETHVAENHQGWALDGWMLASDPP